MYKLFHFLFGWDYIWWKNTADQGVARVYLSDDDVCWYWRYKGTKVADRIKDSDQVIWLTCKASKYIK